MDKSIVIYQPWGGLGDNLAHSTLPEQCHKHGIKCFLSKHNVYRNDGIKKFVWDNNPYIDGEVDDIDLSWFNNITKHEKIGMNHLEAIQSYYGFTEYYHYPKIYYTPKYIQNYEDKTLIDLSAHTTICMYDPKKVYDILKEYNIKDEVIVVTHSNLKYQKIFDISNKFETVDITDLYHYCDLLASCKGFLTFHSGQSTLASTIKNMTGRDTTITVITPGSIMPDKAVNYWYKNTIYVQGD